VQRGPVEHQQPTRPRLAGNGLTRHRWRLGMPARTRLPPDRRTRGAGQARPVPRHVRPASDRRSAPSALTTRQRPTRPTGHSRPSGDRWRLRPWRSRQAGPVSRHARPPGHGRTAPAPFATRQATTGPAWHRGPASNGRGLRSGRTGQGRPIAGDRRPARHRGTAPPTFTTGQTAARPSRHGRPPRPRWVRRRAWAILGDHDPGDHHT